jgi:hypothetical protein
MVVRGGGPAVPADALGIGTEADGPRDGGGQPAVRPPRASGEAPPQAAAEDGTLAGTLGETRKSPSDGARAVEVQDAVQTRPQRPQRVGRGTIGAGALLGGGSASGSAGPVDVPVLAAAAAALAARLSEVETGHGAQLADLTKAVHQLCAGFASLHSLFAPPGGGGGGSGGAGTPVAPLGAVERGSGSLPAPADAVPACSVLADSVEPPGVRGSRSRSPSRASRPRRPVVGSQVADGGGPTQLDGDL